MEDPKKTERQDGRRPTRLVLPFRKGGKAQSERQSTTNSNDSRPRESILFSALRGLNNGVHLTSTVQAGNGRGHLFRGS